jgi:hypothetical protein
MAFDPKKPADPKADGVLGEPTKKNGKVYL